MKINSFLTHTETLKEVGIHLQTISLAPFSYKDSLMLRVSKY